MSARRPGRGGLSAAVALLALACPQAAPARPLTVADVLAREAVGRVELTDRFILAEVRGPQAAAGRFDLDGWTDTLRTTLKVADRTRPGPLRALFDAEPGEGLALGPVSPDGARVAVFRLRNGTWELGVADPAAARVRWLGVTPDRRSIARAVAWQGPHALLVLAVADGETPLDLRLRRYPETAAARRAATAAGGVGATVIGAGAYRAGNPRAPDRRLLRVHLATGAVATLATGPFLDLEPAPNGRHAALLEEAEDIALHPARTVQGDHGIETRRTRLAILDTATGEVRRPCPGCDVLGQLLRWSPDGAELLVFARREGEAWPQGRLHRVPAAGGPARPTGAGLVPLLRGRPATVRAGWMGRDPVVLARPAGRTGSAWPANAPLPSPPRSPGRPARPTLGRMPLARPAPARTALARAALVRPPGRAALVRAARGRASPARRFWRRAPSGSPPGGGSGASAPTGPGRRIRRAACAAWRRPQAKASRRAPSFRRARRSPSPPPSCTAARPCACRRRAGRGRARWRCRRTPRCWRPRLAARWSARPPPARRSSSSGWRPAPHRCCWPRSTPTSPTSTAPAAPPCPTPARAARP